MAPAATHQRVLSSALMQESSRLKLAGGWSEAGLKKRESTLVSQAAWGVCCWLLLVVFTALPLGACFLLASGGRLLL